MALIFDSLLLDIGLLAGCLFLAVYIYFKNSFKYWEKRNVPFVEPTFPFGNLLDVVLYKTGFAEVFTDYYKQLDGHKFGGTYAFSKPGFLFRDPELIKTIMVKDFSHFHDRGFYIDEEVDPLSGHLFLLPGIKWRNLRVKLSPTFTSGKMKMMFSTLAECGIELQHCLDKMSQTDKVIEIKDVLGRFSTDIISSCAFGIQCNCLENPNAEFRQWGRKIFENSVTNMLKGIMATVVPNFMKNLKISLTDKQVTKYFMEMVEDTINYREKNDVRRNDFLQLLIQLKNKGMVEPDHDDDFESIEAPAGTYELTKESIAAQAFVFFGAGFETSSTTMTFCLYELALNPDIQDQLRKEILEVLQKHEGKVTYEAIQKMQYLDKVVSETLRKYPPLPILNRECTKSYTIPGTDVVLDEGMLTVIPVLALQRDPKYYPNPERFDPERFSEEEKQRRHPFVYLPFGEGPRICIGMRFGLMQTKVGLVSLLSKYKVGVSKKTPVPLVLDKNSFIMSPMGGMWLELTKC